MKKTFIVFLALVLTACASLDRSMVSMAVNHNETVDQVERNTLLLNILRAADEQPLTLTALSFIGGNSSLGAGLNVSGFDPYSASTGLNVSAGFSYSLSTLDNEQFMRSFLSDLPFDRLYFLHEGTGLENIVLWTLVTQSVTWNPGKDSSLGRPVLMPNVVKPEAWAAFQTMLSRSLDEGLSMEQVVDNTPIGPRMSRDEALSQVGTVIASWNPPAWAPPSADAARPLLVELGGADSSQTHQLVMSAKKTRLCINPLMGRPAPADTQDLCQGAASAGDSLPSPRQMAGESGSNPVMAWQQVRLRSPREVFYFLGSVVRSQQQDPQRLWTIGTSAQGASRVPKPLVKVLCDANATHPQPLAQALYRGRECQIPGGDDSYSAQVLQYLSLLITLSKVPGALPGSPAVLVR